MLPILPNSLGELLVRKSCPPYQQSKFRRLWWYWIYRLELGSAQHIVEHLLIPIGFSLLPRQGEETSEEKKGGVLAGRWTA
ncbi:unnamed protein product [Victoria cruziana]